MTILSQNHAFAQAGRIFFVPKPAHFDCVYSKYAVYPTTNSNTGLRARGIALSRWISTGLVSTRI
jgi:hypothetical protein